MPLWAASEVIALYKNCCSLKYDKFDPYRFIDGLLSVRTAANLVAFLADSNTEMLSHPHDFSKSDRATPTDGLAPLYERGLFSKALMDAGYDELDALTELEGIECPCDDLPAFFQGWRSIDLEYMKMMRLYLESSFIAASIAFGDAPPDGFLNVMRPTDEPWSGYVHLDFSNIRLSPPARLWEGGFRDPCNQDYLIFADGYLPHDLSEGDSNVIDDKIIELNYDSISTDEAVRSVCAAAVSFAIAHSRDREYPYNSNEYRFSLKESRFDYEKPMPDSLERAVMDEAIRLILGKRIALCKVCGRPFVMAYEKGRETSRRETCGGSCRNKVSKKPIPPNRA